MKTLENYEVQFPAYALSYLINNDSSGLNDVDISATDKFMKEYYDRAKELKAQVIFSARDEEECFNPFPDFGLACNTITVDILIVC